MARAARPDLRGPAARPRSASPLEADGLDPGARSPLDPAVSPPAADWRDTLQIVLADVRGAPMPAGARAAVERLGAAPAADLDALAVAVLEERVERRELAAATFVAAALQAHYAARAALDVLLAEDGWRRRGANPLLASAQSG